MRLFSCVKLNTRNFRRYIINALQFQSGSVTLTVITAVVLSIDSLPQINGQNLDPENPAIIWNGCESRIYEKLKYPEPTVDKPKICDTRLPDYLEGVKPQKTKCPFYLEAITYDRQGSFLIAVTAKHKANDGKFKSRKFPKLNSFIAVYISVKSVDKGMDVGKFEMGDQVESNESFKMGYCCGKSRFHPNFYELQTTGGDWTMDVVWDAGSHKGPVIFNVTVIQDKKTYWLMPPFTTDLH